MFEITGLLSFLRRFGELMGRDIYSKGVIPHD